MTRVRSADRGAEFIEVGLEVRPPQRNRHQSRTRQRHDRGVRVVVGLEDDHLVLGVVEQRQQRGGERLGRTGGHQHVPGGIQPEAVEPLLVLRDRGEQIRDAAARRILVDTVRDRRACGLEHLCGSILVGEALPEIDRTRLRRKGRHLREDGGVDRPVVADESGTRGCAVPGSGDLSHRFTVPGGLIPLA